MMDFEDAAQRLARDQQKLRGRKTMAVSAKAKREADYRKKQQERMRQERQQKAKQQNFIRQYVTSCDRALSVKSLSSNVTTTDGGGGLQLTATSIWGEGDKISLPPSVLEFLTQSSSTGDELLALGGGPWTFRIGLLNPKYNFPESVILQTMKPPKEDEEDETMHGDSDLEDEEHAATSKEAYLDELGFKYISYTHGTVVEFTQEEGHVGIPAPIAAALLDPKRRRKELQTLDVSTTRTVDPSGAPQETGEDNNATPMEEDDNEKTPGHVAYGAFEVPDMPIEITLVSLPKGKGCTLTPTKEAILNGFYDLKDVKLVLEQSLIRTRATLSVGDTVHTWHRGTKFDLAVSKVIPAAFHAVTCINTDIEVEIGQVEPENNGPTTTAANSMSKESGGQTLSGGRVLSAPSLGPPPMTAADTAASPPMSKPSVELLPEPPADQTENICTIQIRGSGFSTAKRRFDVQTATLEDLFAFATILVGSPPTTFQLVTRFPRTEYSLSTSNTTTSMADAGITPGQEMLMVERF